MKKMTKWKEVLILAVGMTPQIVTETIYALATRTPPILPDEVWVITTGLGKRVVEEALIANGVLRALVAEYGLKPVPLDTSSFVLVTDPSGRALDDITTDKDNEAMGDTITTFVREKAKDEGSRLHCSIAGGRKTMSFYLGAALQLFGRPQDKLYHVLVTPEFESNPSFFYKPKRDRTLEVRLPDGTRKTVSTRDARVTLAELPFIRLGHKLAHEGKTFRELVEEGQRGIDTATVQPLLSVSLPDRSLLVDSRYVGLTPVQLMIYVAFLRRKLEGCTRRERVYCGDCRDCFATLTDLAGPVAQEAMARDYGTIYRGRAFRADELMDRWRKGFAPDILRQNISKINRAVREQVGDERLAAFSVIASVRQYGATRYGLRAEKTKLRLEGEGP